MPAFSLRAASELDRNWVFETFKLSMREYVESAWGWDEEFQRNGFWKSIPVEKLKIICVAGQDVGAFCVEEYDQYHYMRTIFLNPDFQGQGVGAKLLTDEADRARISRKRLVLKVIKVNPAKRLYERLGFEIMKEDDATYHMQLV